MQSATPDNLNTTPDELSTDSENRTRIQSALSSLLATTKRYPTPKAAIIGKALDPYKDQIAEIYLAGCNVVKLSEELTSLLDIIVRPKALRHFLSVNNVNLRNVRTRRSAASSKIATSSKPSAVKSPSTKNHSPTAKTVSKPAVPPRPISSTIKTSSAKKKTGKIKPRR